MAWISVHEQVIGGKLRNLAKEIGCSQNEALGILIRLWIWGINNAGKEGCIEGANKDDIAEVLNVGIDKNCDPVKVVDALIETKWIDFDDGLYIHDWEEWQEQWYKALEVRERDAARKRAERQRKRQAKKDAETEVEPKPPIQIPEKPMEEILPTPKLKLPPGEDTNQQPAVPAYSKDFEEFWEVYPKKVGKGEAYKKYKARRNDGWSEAELLEAASKYASKCARERTEKQYIKHPKTFLSDSTPFTDYLSKNETGSSAPVAQSNDDDPYGDWR